MQIDDISRVLLHVQNNYVFLFQTSFFLINVHHSLSKLERILTLKIVILKKFKIGKIHY